MRCRDVFVFIGLIFLMIGCSSTTPSPVVTVDQLDNDLVGYIPEISTTVILPPGYTLRENLEEPNRRGTFAAYWFDQVTNEDPLDASQRVFPYFAEIQLFTDESIRDFEQYCEELATEHPEVACFYGDFPSLERYNSQREAFYAIQDYENFVLRKFEEEYYFVSTHWCEGHMCAVREYTTFIDQIKVDVLILMSDPSKSEKSDELFRNFRLDQ